MKVVISIGKLLLTILFISGLAISYTIYTINQNPAIGRGSNAVIASSNNPNLPAIGACTGALGQSGQSLFNLQSSVFRNGVPETLQQLDKLTISCNGPSDILRLPDNFTNLGGQCCGALTNLTSYDAKLKGLQQFSHIPDVPRNPFNISVGLAKKTLNYDLSAVLTPEQQSILSQAAKMSNEGGPCCCKCWHWYFNEGIAKKLVKEYNFSAQQISSFYDLSDTCGN